MPLKVELKSGEKIILNGAVVRLVGPPSAILIENQATLLRERDVITPDRADTPAKRVAFTIQLMYLDPDNVGAYRADYERLMADFRGAIRTPAIVERLGEIGRAVDQRQFYKALSLMRAVLRHERRVLPD